MILNVKIEKRIATLQDSENKLVCANSGDSIVFVFDSEWNAYPNRTARFKWNGKHLDVEFKGDIVEIPSITDTRVFSVGVYSGESEDGEKEISTTDVKIPCKLSTRCGDSKPHGESGADYTNEARGYAAEARAAAEVALEAADVIVDYAKEAAQIATETVEGVIDEKISEASSAATQAATASVNAVIGNKVSKLDLIAKKTDTFLSPCDVTWESGTLSSSNGAETAADYRLRTNFIYAKDIALAYAANALYKISVFLYDGRKKFLAMPYTPIQEIDMDAVRAMYPNCQYARFLMKKEGDPPINVATDVSASQVYIGRSDYKQAEVTANDVHDKLAIVPVSFFSGTISNGVPVAEPGRCITNKIPYDPDLNVMIDAKYEYGLHFYSGDTRIGGTSGVWLSSTTPLSNFNNPKGDGTVPDSFVIVVRDANNLSPLPADVVDSMKDRVTLFKKDSAIIKIGAVKTGNFEKYGLPVLALTGNPGGMSKSTAVTLNYKYGTRTGTCDCKWQGSSSVRLGYPKRNYTITFDNAFEAKSGWGSHDKYCMKANWIDPSAARNVVNALLWGQVVKSRGLPDSYKRMQAPNFGAVDGFPIILTINGMFEGLYTFNIPKEGWMFAMGEGAAEYLVCSESNALETSKFNKKDATFEGDPAKNTLDFSVEYAPSGVEDETVVDAFNTMLDRVVDAGEGWETTLADCLDIDSVVDYFIFANCIGAHDNLGKNILYGTYNGTKWFMSAYDLDSTYGSHEYGDRWYQIVHDRNQFKEAANCHRLAKLLYTYSKAKLKARYKELRATVLSDENVWYMLTNFVNAIPRHVYNIDAEKWAATYTKDESGNLVWMNMPETSTANVHTYMDYYRMHCAYLDEEVEGPDWPK